MHTKQYIQTYCLMALLVLTFPLTTSADTSSTQATVSATVGTVTTSTPSTPTGGGGGTPPSPPSGPVNPVVPRELDMCDFTCNDSNYELYLVTPNGDRYSMYSSYAQVFALGNGVRTVFFDAFDPLGDFDDVALEVNSLCSDGGIYVELTDTQTGPYRIGFLYESDTANHDVTLWQNTDNVQNYTVRVSATAASCSVQTNPGETEPEPEEEPEPEPEQEPEEEQEEEPVEPEIPTEPRTETAPQCNYDCLNDQYDLYITAPDGSERHMGTQFAVVEEISENVNRIYYEDSVGIDRDFNDVVFDVEQYCDRNLITVNFVSKESTWEHEVWIRVIRNGVQISNVLLWRDSSQAQGEIGIVGGGQTAYCPERQEALRLRQPLIFEPEIRIGGGGVPANFTANIFSTLIQDTITVSVAASYFENVQIEAISLRVAGRFWSLRFNPTTDNYEVTVPIDELGDQLMTIVVDHDGLVDTYPVTLMSLQPGVILSRTEGFPVSGATVTLFNALTDEPWDAKMYNRVNPEVSNDQGQYRFIAPAGEYYLRIEAEGYEPNQTPSFRIENVVNETVELLSTSASLTDRSGQFLEDTAGRALEALGTNGFLGTVDLAWNDFNEWADSPQIEEVVDTYVAPATVLIPAVAVGPALSTTAVPVVQYAFQYIFLQPLLLFGKRKRRKQWGVVYNSLTKRPIDLAIVRLLNANTKKVVQSRVTDGQGRFFFFAEPGGYILDVRKPTFVYPSDLLKGASADGDRLDVYHGEPISVTEGNSEVAPNIPLDPPDASTQTLKKIKIRTLWRTFQQVISLSSIILAAVAYYINPTVKVLVILCLHIFVYTAFMIYMIPTKPKGWGVVYDKGNKKPISKAIARLFSVQYNKLIDTQITDKKGRYAFLVGPSTYRVAVEHPEYKHAETKPLSLEKAKNEDLLVKPHIPLSREEKT